MVDVPYGQRDMIDLPYGHQAIDDDDIAAVVDVLRGDRLTQGPAVERFEAALCAVTGAEHAVAFASGTIALHASLWATGIGKGNTPLVVLDHYPSAVRTVILEHGARPPPTLQLLVPGCAPGARDGCPTEPLPVPVGRRHFLV